jgi:hypothetical protein
MPIPSEPNKLILNNLTAKNLYEYYILNKTKIIKECDRRPVLLFNKYDSNKELTIVRKYNNSPIILDNETYENIISGYTVSISVESQYPGKYLKQKLIDIDYTGNVSEKDLKECVKDLARFYNKFNYHITNSSNGYHFRVDIVKQANYKALANTEIELKKEFGNKYLINSKLRVKPSNTINLDLIAMNERGSLTVPYGLNRNGSICSYIDIKNLDRFDRNSTLLN